MRYQHTSGKICGFHKKTLLTLIIIVLGMLRHCVKHIELEALSNTCGKNFVLWKSAPSDCIYSIPVYILCDTYAVWVRCKAGWFFKCCISFEYVKQIQLINIFQTKFTSHVFNDYKVYSSVPGSSQHGGNHQPLQVLKLFFNHFRELVLKPVSNQAVFSLSLILCQLLA